MYVSASDRKVTRRRFVYVIDALWYSWINRRQWRVRQWIGWRTRPSTPAVTRNALMTTAEAEASPAAKNSSTTPDMLPATTTKTRTQRIHKIDRCLFYACFYRGRGNPPPHTHIYKVTENTKTCTCFISQKSKNFLGRGSPCDVIGRSVDALAMTWLDTVLLDSRHGTGSLGHWVIIVTRCVTRRFSIFVIFEDFDEQSVTYVVNILRCSLVSCQSIISDSLLNQPILFHCLK